MNKFDIIKILAKKKDLSTQDADQIISIITEEISNSLYYGDRVEFRGFGVFYTNTRKKRLARNPKTGKEISVKEKKIPHFRIAKLFYELINK